MSEFNNFFRIGESYILEREFLSYYVPFDEELEQQDFQIILGGDDEEAPMSIGDVFLVLEIKKLKSEKSIDIKILLDSKIRYLTVNVTISENLLQIFKHLT